MLNKSAMIECFEELDRSLDDNLNLLIGGGAALILNGTTSFTTYDIDGMPFKSSIDAHELRVYRDKVSTKLNVPKDWLNEYFYQFTHSLPLDYGDRLKEIFSGKKLNSLFTNGYKSGMPPVRPVKKSNSKCKIT